MVCVANSRILLITLIFVDFLLVSNPQPIDQQYKELLELSSKNFVPEKVDKHRKIDVPVPINLIRAAGFLAAPPLALACGPCAVLPVLASGASVVGGEIYKEQKKKALENPN